MIPPRFITTEDVVLSSIIMKKKNKFALDQLFLHYRVPLQGERSNVKVGHLDTPKPTATLWNADVDPSD